MCVGRVLDRSAPICLRQVTLVQMSDVLVFLGTLRNAASFVECQPVSKRGNEPHPDERSRASGIPAIDGRGEKDKTMAMATGHGGRKPQCAQA